MQINSLYRDLINDLTIELHYLQNKFRRWHDCWLAPSFIKKSMTKDMEYKIKYLESKIEYYELLMSVREDGAR